MTGLALTSSTMPVCANVRKPGSTTSNLYGPVGRLGRTYDPVSLLTTVRIRPVSVCVAVISAPGNRAPLWSITVPLICAVACPHTAGHDNKRLRQIPNRHFAASFIELPPVRLVVLSVCCDFGGQTILTGYASQSISFFFDVRFGLSHSSCI